MGEDLAGIAAVKCALELTPVLLVCMLNWSAMLELMKNGRIGKSGREWHFERVKDKG